MNSRINIKCKNLCSCNRKVTNVHMPKLEHSRKYDSHGDICSPLQYMFHNTVSYAQLWVCSVIKNLNFSMWGGRGDEVKKALRGVHSQSEIFFTV